MTEQLTIRQETPEDFSEVFEVNQIAFEQDNEATLVEGLRRNPTVFIPELSLVATDNNKIILYLDIKEIRICHNT